ncbi:MAG: HIT domain-containing protein [Bacteroidetes bacterium]|nr:HIT domain-containing protein [Bacteroidota bacterium]
MEKLWSPWRSQYIEAFKSDDSDAGCIFCKAVDDNIEDDNSLVVYKGEYSFIVLNLYPYNSGHLMIVPNRHISDLTLLTGDELAEMMRFVQLVLKALALSMKPHGFNYGANLGKAAGAGIDDHIHFHVVPRWTGDTNFMPMLGEVRVISQDLLKTKQNIIKAISEINLEGK